MHVRTVVSGKKESVPDFETAEIRFSPVACGCVRGRCVTFAQPIAAVLVPPVRVGETRHTPKKTRCIEFLRGYGKNKVHAVAGKLNFRLAKGRQLSRRLLSRIKIAIRPVYQRDFYSWYFNHDFLFLHCTFLTFLEETTNFSLNSIYFSVESRTSF